MGGYRIGVDIGGTFTDLILHNAADGRVSLHKLLTTPHDPSTAALQGIREIAEMAGIAVGDVDEIVHGTTLVTNAVIERKGAPLGLITTAGFRDILEMGREQRYDIYDLFLDFPDPMVPRNLRCEVPERIDRDGVVIQAVDEAVVRTVLAELVAAGVKAVGVSLINAYRNPAHERAIGRIAREAFPDLAVSLSSEVVPEIGEYERTTTTCANAYVQPLVARYLARLEDRLGEDGFRGTLRLMHSAGGLISTETARAFPIRLLESGPAGGALAAALFGARVGYEDVIAFDMGGTTAKACMVANGAIDVAPELEAGRVSRFRKGSGLPIKSPVIDMIEIGAGGGSIATVDEVGLLKVGPLSAGSDPGPVCYGAGGQAPTVTDANLILGYYDPDFFLGGRMALDKPAAEAALQGLSDRLGLSLVETAEGIHKVVVEEMAAAARVHLVEKGRDPRRQAMVGFGGAGPAHAANVARVLGVGEVIVPPASGAASSLGFLTAPLSFETVRSMLCPLDVFDGAAVDALLAEMEAEARSHLPVEPDSVTVTRTADMRLVGQMHEIAVPLPDGSLVDAIEAIRAAFVGVYSARYTTVYADASIEAITFRVACTGPKPMIALSGEVERGDALKGHRRAWFAGAWHEAAVYDRYRLTIGTTLTGPAIIEEREATTLVPPGDTLTIDEGLNLRIAVAPSAAAAVTVSETADLTEAMAAIRRDPIALEIMWSRLVTVTEEMWITVIRTAFSLTVSESQDFACELLDPQGETLAHSPRAMPVFNLTLPRAVKALLEKFPAETLVPGDVLITNDPWLCAGHLYDIAVVTPVFVQGRVVGLTGTVGHVSDIGGTKDSLSAREIYEEGFQIPPMKFYEAGKPNAALIELLAANIRAPAETLGDLHAFIAANQLGAERLAAFMQDYGLRDLKPLAHLVQGLSEQAMRKAVAAIPDGTYRATITNRPQGEQLEYPVALTVSGDSIAIDFAGAPPQLGRGGLNATLNYTAAHATYPLKCILTPGMRGNAGCYRPFSVTAPEGSVLNPSRPAAVQMRTRTGWYIAPNIFRALADAVPGLVQSHTGLPVAITVYGETTEGARYNNHLFVGGGQGGSDGKDGKSGLLWPTSAANTAVEVFEARGPVLVCEKSFMPDTGGPGRHRGGLGQRVRLRKLYDDGRPAMFVVAPEGVDNPIDGLFGGGAGRGARGAIHRGDGTVRDCGTGEAVTLTQAGDIVEICISGGSGFGDPAERPRAALDRDEALGLITPEHRRRDYAKRSDTEVQPAARSA
jgi:5-oxoprolinase (ATP-hydrolysing)